jgi:hypothetical protein
MTDEKESGRRGVARKESVRRGIDKVEELKHLPIRTCPYVEDYKFKLCEITTCKNYSIVTNCHCLSIDRVSTTGIKVISDAELNLFKFSEKKVTTRLISMRRKQAIERVKCMLILKRYLDFVIEKYELQGENSPFIKGRYIQSAQTRYPLSTRKLRFKNWMWHYIVDPVVLEEFKEQHKGGECKEFKIEQMLNVTSLKYERLLKEIKISTKPEKVRKKK